MEHNKERSDEIDRYMLQQMEDDELNAFRERLESDPDLAAEVTLQEDLVAGIRLRKNRKMKTALNQIHEEVVQAKPAPKSRRLLWYPLAAVASILLLLFVYQTLQPAAFDHQKTFAQFYQTHQLNLASRNGADEKELLQIDALYKTKNYKALSPLIKSTLDKIKSGSDVSENLKNTQSKLLLGAGLVALNLKQSNQAIAYFQEVIEQNDPFFKDHSHWYLALTYLQQNNLDACKKQLNYLIQDTRADHHNDAKELLDLLQ